MEKTPSYYEVLGVSQDATAEEIQAAAQALSQKFPEEAQDPERNVAYRQLVRAYKVLGNADRRAAYDVKLAESGSDLLQIDLHPSRRTLEHLETVQLLYLLVDIFAPAEEYRQRLPINLSLVFDRSTSMQGVRLRRVRAAAHKVIESLSSEDLVSIVVFSDRAEVIVPAGHVKNKRALIGRINQITASGGTEIYQGLRAGMQEIGKAPLSRFINHVVLMTDGQTYGDETECLKLAEASAGRGVTMSAFGIGTDWNDSFLDQLVSPGGGHSAYIEHADQIVSHLQEQIEGLGTIYAQDVTLSVALPDGVRCKDVFKVSPFAQPLGCPKKQLNLGAVEGGLPLSILLELEMRTQRTGSQIPISLEFQVTVPSRQIAKRRLKRSLTLNVVPGTPEFSPPGKVLQAVQMLNLYRMNEKAWQELQEGKTEKATRRMERLTSRLMEAGQTELAQQALRETQRLAHMGTLSLEGRKKLKYGTRSLIAQTMQLKEND